MTARKAVLNTYIKTCKCGKEFTSRYIKKIYCGSIKDKVGCSFIHRSSVKGSPRDLTMPVVCKICKKEFLPKSSTQVMCGDRVKKEGCAYLNYLHWSQTKRDNFTDEQKEEFKKYKVEWHLLRKYNLTVDEYYTKLTEQDFKCEICKKESLENNHGKLYIDHNHTTGEVRGLLCHGCNAVLGLAKESEYILLESIKYLKKWNTVSL